MATSLRQTIVYSLSFMLFVQVVLAYDSGAHDSRLSRSHKHKFKRERQPRKTKFSDLGPFGIRAHDPLTAKINHTHIGFIPDAGDTGGKFEHIQEITKSLEGKRPACFGWYAQVSPSEQFDGKQLFEVMDDLKNSKAVLSPAIMPQGGWQGFTEADDSQAQRIAKVLRKFTDEGIPVILRFAHEMNWYQHTGQYKAHPAQFKEAWKVVAKACRKLCPDCYLHWTPNVSTMDDYLRYAPDDMDSWVDLVGIDYYPTSPAPPGHFVKVVKEFHDRFAINGRKFAIGETGLHFDATIEERVSWLTQMASSRDQLPNLVFINWYNSQKEWNYKIAGKGVSTTLLTEKLE